MQDVSDVGTSDERRRGFRHLSASSVAVAAAAFGVSKKVGSYKIT